MRAANGHGERIGRVVAADVARRSDVRRFCVELKKRKA